MRFRSVLLLTTSGWRGGRVQGAELESPLSLKNKVPLTKEDFDGIYTYQGRIFPIRFRENSQRRIL